MCKLVIGHDKMIRDSAGSGARKWSRKIFADLQIAQSACSSLLLPAPAEQAQSDEARGEERECSGQWNR